MLAPEQIDHLASKVDALKARVDALACKTDAAEDEPRDASGKWTSGGGGGGGAPKKPGWGGGSTKPGVEHGKWEEPKTAGGITTHRLPYQKANGKTGYGKVHSVGENGHYSETGEGYTRRHGSLAEAKQAIEASHGPNKK